MDIDKLIEHAGIVRSLTVKAEREILANLAAEVPAGGVIVEIGCLYGGTTAILALANPQAVVVSIDDFSWHPADDQPTSPQLLMENMAKVNVNSVSVMAGDSRVIGAEWKKPVDLVFIDGGHSYEFVYPDLCNFSKWSPVVALHDFDNPAWPSTRKAIEQFLGDNPTWKLDQVVETVAVLRNTAVVRNLSVPFEEIYTKNYWADTETRSGGGSRLDRTAEVRAELPKLMKKYKVASLLDAGCGDWNWMSRVALPGVEIQACDIVGDLIADNKRKYGSQASFFCADMTADALPKVDLILCRTVLFHLSFLNAQKILAQFKASGSKYLLATTHPNVFQNMDAVDGHWRRLNLQLEPFNLPKPLTSFADGPGNDGHLALWRL